MAHFGLQKVPDYQPDYNIPPEQKILSVVGLEDGGNKAVYTLPRYNRNIFKALKA